jgi:hypothetical protein
VILPGSFYGKVRSGRKDVRIVSMLRLITTRRCTTEAFTMAGERASLRFVNCWSMTGAFRRRSFRSGPHRDGGRVISAAFGNTLLFHGGRGDRASPECAQDVPGEEDGVQAFPRTSPMITRTPCQVGHGLIQITADRGLTCRRAVAGSCHG